MCRIWPRQNFLVDETVIEKLLALAELKSGDNVLEIGAGTGTLAKEIAQKAKSVLAIENDEILFEVLNREFWQVYPRLQQACAGLEFCAQGT